MEVIISRLTVNILAAITFSAVYLLARRIKLGRDAAGKRCLNAKSNEEDLLNFDWQTTEPRQLRPFKKTYHITMGLQSSSLSDLITMDRDYLQRVELRRELLAKYDDTVHGCLPEGRDAVRELYTLLLGDLLPARFPAMFKTSASRTSLTNVATGKVFPTSPSADGAAMLRVMGETVEEDMFLLEKTPDGHRCVAFICCFPSGFDPSAKLGKLLKEIHAPVPSYEKIGPSMERFFAKLEAGNAVKRMNWAIQTHPALFNCPIQHNHGLLKSATMADQDVDISITFLRVELQTLTRLPRTGAILFGFKTYLYPIQEIKDEGSGPQLADAIEGLAVGNAPSMPMYKKSVHWGPAVCKYLRA